MVPPQKYHANPFGPCFGAMDTGFRRFKREATE